MTSLSGRPVAVLVDEVTKVGEARRLAAALVSELGFEEAARGKVALYVTEAATNLVKHARDGELILQCAAATGRGGIEVLALDRGPGMNNVARCLEDGYSTAGSPGTGMGAMMRAADAFAIHSLPGSGSATWGYLASTNAGPVNVDAPWQVGGICMPYPGEIECGDGWACLERGGRLFVMIADGLGHGPPAAEAAQAALEVFCTHPADEPTEILAAAHTALRATRGAAVAIARIDAQGRQVRFSGVGNISGTVLDTTAGRTSSMVSHAGTVGHAARKIQAFDYPWTDRSLLVMHSDGLTTHWDLGRFPGLSQQAPALVAGVLYRDFRRGRDDVTVVAARGGGGP